MPGDGLTHGPPATKKQAAVTTGLAGSTGIPCAMGYGLYALSPVSGLVSHRPPSSRRVGRKADIAMSRRLIPASGDQDHATSPSASATLVWRASASIASPPHVS